MNFLLSYPTLKRPQWFKSTLTKYIEFLSKKQQNNYQFIISCNDDDLSMNNKEIIDFINNKNLQVKNIRVHVLYGKIKSKIQACNFGAKNAKSKWDVCILVSDDMIPVIKDFDIIIEQEFKQKNSLDYALWFYDGRQKNICTLSILGKDMYNRFGYIYNNSYKSVYCDNEYTDIIKRDNKVKFIDKVIIKHDWKGRNFDQVYIKNQDRNMYMIDRATYNRRKAKNFIGD